MLLWLLVHRKARKSQIDENENTRRIRKRFMVTCTQCKELGHNKRICPPLRKQDAPQQPRPIRKRRRLVRFIPTYLFVIEFCYTFCFLY